MWAAGLFVELLGPILAVRTLSNPRVSFHPRHIAERYGLFTIIVLGESVLAVAVGTADTNWAPSAVRPAVFWGYGHFADYAGIAAFGVGTQLAIEATAQAEGALALASAAPAGGYGLGMRLVLAGGVALYPAGIAFVDRVNEGTV